MAKALVSLYVITVLALLATAVAIWRLQCESFGCMGVGVAWFAWVIGFVLVLGLGAWARSKAALVAGFAQACNLAWWLQLGMGAFLVAAWVIKQVM
nr:hypothetical protein [uncultured Rhodoferax sp.]